VDLLDAEAVRGTPGRHQQAVGRRRPARRGTRVVPPSPGDLDLVEAGQAGLQLRSAFCSASAKVRPIAIASPTDFIEVVSRASAPGNFSKAKRGILVTT
jgi:hypothetical protein